MRGLQAFLFPQPLPPCSNSCCSRLSGLLGFGLLVRVLSIHVLVAVFPLFLSSHSCPLFSFACPIRIANLYHHLTLSLEMRLLLTLNTGRLKCVRVRFRPPFSSALLPSPCFNIACTVRSKIIFASKFKDNLNSKR